MEKPYVYVTRKLPNDMLAKLAEIARIGMWESLEEQVPQDILKAEAKTATALITMVSDQVDESVLTVAPNLKAVANLGVGYDNIDVAAATKQAVYVCNTPNVLSDTTADLTFALLMATARKIVEADQFIKADHWQDWHPFLMAGSDIHHKTIGIVGMGSIGEKVAKRATGFEMEILYHNRSRKPEVEQAIGATYASFTELLNKSDFVVSLAPLTDETKDLFNEEAFQQMKKTAIFINAGRGLLVDEQALYHALVTGQIAAAGLDVFRTEPIKQDHPLLTLPNVVALPHIGSATLETREKMIQLAVNNVYHVLKGKLPVAFVNHF